MGGRWGGSVDWWGSVRPADDASHPRRDNALHLRVPFFIMVCSSLIVRLLFVFVSAVVSVHRFIVSGGDANPQRLRLIEANAQHHGMHADGE